MQTFPLRRPVAAFLCVLVLVACARPVVQARLRGAGLPGRGYLPMTFAANYPGAVVGLAAS